MSRARPLFHPLSSGNLKYFICLSSFTAFTSGETFASSSGLFKDYQIDHILGEAYRKGEIEVKLR